MKLLVTLLLCLQIFGAGAKEVVMWSGDYDTPHLREVMLNALALTEEDYGPFTLVPSSPVEQGRAFSELANNKNIDIFVGGVSIQREQAARAVYVPISRALLGVRICLIPSDNPDFININTIEDIREQDLTFGLGIHWPDSLVFKAYAFNVVESPIYSSLFNMLKKQRFDCFPRSILEIDTELAQDYAEGLRSEKHLLIVYPLADFVFVSKENTALHERISVGMQRSIENGSFDEIFNRYHMPKILRHNISERTIVRLENNNMTQTAADAINKYGFRIE
ncbi:transporter substrate-binding domain-containing protein [Glaciecola sp. XM2]|uniref:transporter substrate-binding domain-containing protein n=1 Tax=Glaciecola sp. XM2 TaxID=1914931 RepID=UPI001BDE38DC|nr:transporter substrate-binding domain-containing protein [Glaciecola sp. XM2]MBT1451275.1 transporter substrate-binding domain-containing protein [Glaciecola sp. XM2]